MVKHEGDVLGEAHEPPLEGALHPEPRPSLVLHTRVLSQSTQC